MTTTAPPSRIETLSRLVGFPAAAFRLPEADVPDIAERLVEEALRGGDLDDLRAAAGTATYRNGFRRSLVADRVADFHRLARHAREKVTTLDLQLAALQKERDELAGVIAG